MTIVPEVGRAEPSPDPGAPVSLSVVVPARDEAANLDRLVDEVVAALDPLGIAWELVVVDDGSVDDTPSRLRALAARDPRVRSLRLDPSQGQTAALVAGFRAARGAYLATLDGDLQCPPAEIPALLAMLDGADLACGVRAKRHDPPLRRLASRLSNGARRLLVARDVRDLACPVRVFRRTALADVERMTPLFYGAHRWLPALFDLAGLRIAQRPVAHRERTAGASKYTTRGRVRPVLREIGTVLRLGIGRPGRIRTLFALATLAAVAAPLLYGLGAWPLIEPDEGRNAEVAREMLASGRWAVPYFDGLPYLDKPVLLFWMIAGAFRVLGVNELAARLPSALAGIAVIGLTFDLGRLLLGWRRGLLAAVVVATTPIVLAYARLVIFDLPLTALTTAAIWCLVRARLGGERRIWFPLFGLVLGLAILMKGPVGVAVPLLAWLPGRSALRGRRPGRAWAFVAAAGAALVVAPWLAAVSRQTPGFLHYALVEETFHRLTSADRFNRAAPPYFYLVTLAWALGIWGLLLAWLSPALVRLRRAGGDEAGVVAFAARGTVALVVFFTLSASKRPHYILPTIPLLALLVAIAIDAARDRATGVIRAAGWTALAGGAGTLVAVAAGVRITGDFQVFVRHVLIGAGVAFLVWGALVAVAARTPWRALACAALVVPAAAGTLFGAFGIYAEARSARTLAEHVGDARVVAFDAFRTSLPFYLGRTVPLVSGSPRALTSNYMLAQPLEALRPQLVAPKTLPALMMEDDPPLVVAHRTAVARLRKLSPRPLTIVFGDRVSVLLAPAH